MFCYFIQDIGFDIHQRSQGRLERDKEQAVQEAEERLWEHAEKVKYEALDKLSDKLSAEHEKAVKKQTKEREKAIKVICDKRTFHWICSLFY
jgi:hypothetical protein